MEDIVLKQRRPATFAWPYYDASIIYVEYALNNDLEKLVFDVGGQGLFQGRLPGNLPRPPYITNNFRKALPLYHKRTRVRHPETNETFACYSGGGMYSVKYLGAPQGLGWGIDLTLIPVSPEKEVELHSSN